MLVVVRKIMPCNYSTFNTNMCLSNFLGNTPGLFNRVQNHLLSEISLRVSYLLLPEGL